MSILLLISVGIIFYLVYRLRKETTYISAQIVDKDQDMIFYVMEYGKYVGEEPTMIFVDETTYNKHEVGDWITI